jgi:nitrite reductase/ring-hydroxylating ferredoxin subunit
VDREWFVGTSSEFDEQRRKIVTIGEHEIVVFQVRGRMYAFDNWCLHQGGPVGEGLLIGKVEAVVTPDRQVTGHPRSGTPTCAT